jgi:hypothetical protein
VPRPERVGDEHLDLATEQLLARVSEQDLDLPVAEHDLARPVRDDHRIGGRLQQGSVLLLGAEPLGDVPQDG